MVASRTLAGVGLLVLVMTGPVLAQCPDGTPRPCPTPVAHAPAPAPNSIAVLPFGNRSPGTADVYLAEGMTEEVGNHLTQLARLQVKARGVVEAEWRHSTDPVGAARALGVAWYVHGNVLHAAPQLVVNVELVRPATGEQVWAKRFTRSDADIFAAQAEVAESVAVVVGGRLSPGERAALARRPSRNNEAYRLYLYGNALAARGTQLEKRRAVEAYTEAVRLDPSFAAAWARLSSARASQYDWDWHEDVPRDSLLALAVHAARRALRLDSLSSEGWQALGMTMVETGDIATGARYFERSLRLDSVNPEAFAALATVYGPTVLVIHDVAAPLYRRALALDPNRRNTWRLLAVLDRSVGRLEESEALLDTALALGPWWVAFLERSYVRFLRGNVVGALADVAEGERLGSSYLLAELRALYAIPSGDSVPARAVLARLRAQADSGQPYLPDLARCSMALGLRQEAMSALERLRGVPDPFEKRCASATLCSVSLPTWVALHDPIFAPLRGDPRFERLWQETRPRVPWLESYH